MATTSSESYPSDNRSLGEFGEQFKRKWQKRAKRRANRTRDVEHFERQERARAKMRFYELSSLAAIYAKERCSGNIENAYEELIKALDDVGFLGTRVLYLHPDVIDISRGRFDPATPPPHKTSPLITGKFIAERIKQNKLPDTITEHLARCWVRASPAARWLRSKGIAVPAPIAIAAGQPTGDNAVAKSGNSRSASPTSIKLPRRPRGPSPAKMRAATEKLRRMLRNGQITLAELTHDSGQGGRKQQDIANLLGVRSRTTPRK